MGTKNGPHTRAVFALGYDMKPELFYCSVHVCVVIGWHLVWDCFACRFYLLGVQVWGDGSLKVFGLRHHLCLLFSTGSRACLSFLLLSFNL